MRRAALLSICACGPITGVAADTESGSSSTQASLTDAVSITANSTVPPQEVTTLEGGPYDAASYPESGFDDGIKLDIDADPCPRTFEVYPPPGAVSLLIDASQTMVTGLVDHDGDAMTPEITRWQLVVDALTLHLPSLVDIAAVEVWSFPRFGAAAPPDLDACSVTGPLSFGQSAEIILQYVPPADATFLDGATPTAAALSGAQADLTAYAALGPSRIVVITDGAPNCYSAASPPELFDDLDTSAYEWASYANDLGIDTHVIGVAVPDGSWGGGPEGDAITQHRDALTLLAQAGGTGVTFADDAASLDAALAAIEQSAQSCRLSVPSDLWGFWYHVVIGGERYYYELSPELCPNNAGFVRLDVPGYEIIELCGSACQSLVAHGSAVIEEECAFPE